jgi:hypothetical protein
LALRINKLIIFNERHDELWLSLRLRHRPPLQADSSGWQCGYTVRQLPEKSCRGQVLHAQV